MSSHQPSAPPAFPVSRRSFSLGATLGVGALLAPGGLAAVDAHADTIAPAFPGAEGCGKWVTGGRGKDVYVVTTLADTGPGSLRDATSQSDRTIVFAVSGTIELQSELAMKGSNLTIAGQTAPGDGICLAGYTTSIRGTNVIMRYLRFRMGDLTQNDRDSFTMRRTQDVIIDHCSMTWGIDEALSAYENSNVTIQWCLIAESLTMSASAKGRHGFIGIWGGDHISYHHNLIAHSTSRNPRFAPGNLPELPLSVDHRQNVIYNWGYNSCYGGERAEGINVIGNYYRQGPDTLDFVARRIANPTVSTAGGPGAWYVADNVVQNHADVTADNWLGVDAEPGAYTQLSAPYPFSDIPPTTTAQVAYNQVLAGAGAVLPRRDSVDARIVADVRAVSGRAINSQSEVGGWPVLRSTSAPVDSDGDGIPDAWELAHGLDPNDASDGKTVGADGYTNLERYLNSITPTGAASPTVSITAPALNAVVPLNSNAADATTAVTITATASGQGADIAKVEFRAGVQLIGTATQSPHTVTWADAPEGTHYLTATAVDSTGTSTSSSAVPLHVARRTDVAPWTSVDIGYPRIAGAAGTLGTSSLVVRGSGAIAGGTEGPEGASVPVPPTPDHCHYVHQELRGDGQIVARVDAFRKAYPGMLGGLMLRSSLGASGAEATIALTWDGDGLVSRLVRRTEVHGANDFSQYPAVAADDPITLPYWLRLVRAGTSVTGSISADAQTWHDVGTVTLPLLTLSYVGLVVDGRQEDNGISNYGSVTFSQVAVTPA